MLCNFTTYVASTRLERMFLGAFWNFSSWNILDVAKCVGSYALYQIMGFRMIHIGVTPFIMATSPRSNEYCSVLAIGKTAQLALLN